MSEGIISSLAKLFEKLGNTDHFPMEKVDEIAASKGADKLAGSSVNCVILGCVNGTTD